MINVNIDNQLVSITGKIMLFLQENPDSSIKTIRENVVNPHTKKNIDFNLTSSILIKLNEKGLCETIKEGKQKLSRLTMLGTNISGNLEAIQKELER